MSPRSRHPRSPRRAWGMRQRTATLAPGWHPARRARPRPLRADRRRQDRAGASRSPTGCAPAARTRRGLRRRAAGLRGAGDPDRRRRTPRRARAARAPARVASWPCDETFSVGALRASWPTPRSTTCSSARRHADRRRRHRPVPARRARRARPAPAAGARGPRARCMADAGARGARGAARRAGRPRARGRGRHRPARPPSRRPRARAARRRRAADRARRRDNRLWTTDTRHPTLLVGLTMDRDALHARIDARVDAMVAAGARDEVRAARRRGRVGHRAQGARLRRAAGRRRRGDEDAHAPLRQAPAHLAAQAARRRARRLTGRAPRTSRAELRRHESRAPMRFEKWQALGNDYIILERGRLPFALTRRACGACATATSASAPTACSSSRPPDADGLRRAPADLQPRRLGGRAVGQRRARGRPVPAPPRLDRRRDSSRSRPSPARSAPTIHRRALLPLDMGRARCVRDFPPAARRAGRSRRRGTWRFQHVTIGNPQCADPRRRRRASSRRSTSPQLGPGDRAPRRVPEPHQRLVLDARSRPTAIRARIFERGVGETSVVGHRRQRRGGRARAARRRLAR